jgi:hypothetical protein
MMYEKANLWESLVRLGIEKGFVFKNRCRPSVAFDFTGIKAHSNSVLVGGFGGYNDNITKNANGIGFMPALGFEFKVVSCFSVSIESKARFAFYKSSYKAQDLEFNSRSWRGTYTYHEINGSPILFMLNFHF